MAVTARRQDQGGEAVEQLEGVELDQGVAVHIGLGQLVDDGLLADAQQPPLGKGMPGSVSGQPLQTLSVVVGNVDRGIEGKAAMVVPAEHVVSIVGIEAVVAHQMGQHAFAQRLGQLGDGLCIEVGAVVDAQRALGIERKDGVGHQQVAMGMGIEAGTELMREHNGPNTSVAWCTRTTGANVRFDAAHADA